MEVFGDWSVYQPYEEEQDIPELVNPQNELAERLDASYGSDKLKLYQKLNGMSRDEKETFVKIIQYDAMMDSLHAIKNLKKTSGDEWKNVIGKLISLKDISFRTKDGFDFSALTETLIPALAFLAGTLLAMRESERKDIECAEPAEENNPLLNDPEFQNGADEQISKSLILQYCHNKQNGFSL
jgi:hypothetical protein